eukprot:scaffold67675_cov65-Phaeocystis_antarctica.AAC.2
MRARHTRRRARAARRGRAVRRRRLPPGTCASSCLRTGTSCPSMRSASGARRAALHTSRGEATPRPRLSARGPAAATAGARGRRPCSARAWRSEGAARSSLHRPTPAPA